MRTDQRLSSEGFESLTVGKLARWPRYDFPRHRSVLDLGGGTGPFLMAVLSQHSGAEGTRVARGRRLFEAAVSW